MNLQLYPHGPTYYRLKMVDTDGATTFSKALAVNTGNQPAVAILPTPTHNRLAVQLHNRTAETVTIPVVALQG